MRGVRFDPERREVRLLAARAPFSGASVVEVGCGDGRLTRRLAGRARGWVGIDADAERIRQARARVPARLADRVRFQEGVAERLAFPAGTFDIALFSWSL